MMWVVNREQRPESVKRIGVGAAYGFWCPFSVVAASFRHAGHKGGILCIENSVWNWPEEI